MIWKAKTVVSLVNFSFPSRGETVMSKWHVMSRKSLKDTSNVGSVQSVISFMRLWLNVRLKVY